MADLTSSVDPATKAFLGKEMYLVVTRPVRSPEIANRLADHLAHQVELEKRGIMFAAGPLYPRNSEVPEAGMFVLRASSFEEAEAIANEDPLHKAGLRTVYASEVAVERGAHYGHGRFFRSDDEARLKLRRRFVTPPSAEIRSRRLDQPRIVPLPRPSAGCSTMTVSCSSAIFLVSSASMICACVSLCMAANMPSVPAGL